MNKDNEQNSTNERNKARQKKSKKRQEYCSRTAIFARKQPYKEKTVRQRSPPCHPSVVDLSIRSSTGSSTQPVHRSTLNRSITHVCMYLCSLPAFVGQSNKKTNDEPPLKQTSGFPEQQETRPMVFNGTRVSCSTRGTYVV